MPRSGATTSEVLTARAELRESTAVADERDVRAQRPPGSNPMVTWGVLRVGEGII